MHSIGAQKVKVRKPRRLIKNIQRGEITIAAGASSATATIHGVNTRYAAGFFGGCRNADTSLDTTEDYARVSLTNATTVTAQTSAANAGNDRIVRYTVIEFAPFAIRRIQQGTITISSGTSNTATIAAVNTTRAFVAHQGQNHSTTHADFNYNQGRLDLTNATTVTLTKDNANNPNLSAGYVVIEFAPGIVRSIQQTTINIAGSSATGDATITAVNDTSTLLMQGGWTIGAFGSSVANRMPHVHRTSTTNVRATRGTSGTSTTIQQNITVVEFEPRWVRSRNTGQTQIAGAAASANAALSASVNIATTWVSWLGHLSSSGVASVPSDDYGTAKLNSASQVTVERAGSPATTLTISWETLEFQ